MAALTGPVPAPPSTDEVAERAEEVRRRIAAAGGDPGAVQLIAMTKGFGREAVTAAMGAGLRDLGENYAQELTAKHRPEDGTRLHFLGPVQRNKVPTLAPLVTCWHAVDRVEAGLAIVRRAPEAALLVQVNVGSIQDRPGCPPDAVAGLVDALRQDDARVQGLMAVAPGTDREDARRCFATVAGLARSLELSQLSMGMTDDLEEAIAEGATMVRIGRALFGPRSGPDDLRR